MFRFEHDRAARSKRVFRHRFRRLQAERLESRCVLSALADGAYEWLHDAATANTGGFYVYQDADSGFNHGFPSGLFAGDGSGLRQDLIDATVINSTCVSDLSAPTGCTSDPDALDQQRGTVLQLKFPALQGSAFVGLNVLEPEKYDPFSNPVGNGYDLRGATRLLFDLRSVAPQPWQIRLEVAGQSTPFVQIPAAGDFTSYCIDLVHRPPTGGCLGLTALPDLSDVHKLMTVVTDAAHGPSGGTLLFDDIRFDPPPNNPTHQPRHSFPLANQTFGVAPAVIKASDDGDASYAMAGPWAISPNANAYLQDQHLAPAGSAATASWTFTGLEPRDYVVEATWALDPFNATNAPFTLRDATELGETFVINQALSPMGGRFDEHDWQRVGEARVTSGTLVVELSAALANGQVAADGVRIVPTIPPDQAIRNLTTIYESSLAIFAALDRRTPADLLDARQIADTIVYALRNDVPGSTSLPTAPDGSRGLRDAYSSGDLALFNSQQSTDPLATPPQAGDIRVAGFSSDARLCRPTTFCLVLDGAYGGNNAFGILALVQAYEEFADDPLVDAASYLAAAREIGNWVYGNLVDHQGPYFNSNPATQSYGGYFLGYPDQGVDKDRVASLVRGKSIENNGDLYAAFSRLAEVQAKRGQGSEAADWTRRAHIAGDFVMSLYDAGSPTDPRDGRFAAGTLPDGPSGPSSAPGLEPDLTTLRGGEFINRASLLDSNTFTTLPLAASARYHAWLDEQGEPIDWREPLRYVIDTFPRQIQVSSPGGPGWFKGYSISTTPTRSPFRPGGPIGGLVDGIAWEFTAQVATTGRFLDELYGGSEFAGEAATIVEQLRSAQEDAPFGDGRGLVASTLDDPSGTGQPPLDQCLGTPFQCIAARPGLAATAWAIFADVGLNPFTPRSTLVNAGQSFTVDDFNNKVTRFDLGSNDFGGNSGAINLPKPTNLDEENCGATDQITCVDLALNSHGANDDSLAVDFDFGRATMQGEVGGVFTSLFGLTDTKTILTANAPEPAESTPIPGYYLDLLDLFRGSQWRPDRSAEWLELDLRLASSDPVTLKIELTEELPPGAPSDANPHRIYTYRLLDKHEWETVQLRLPSIAPGGLVAVGDFGFGDTATFDPRRVSVAALIVERSSGAVENPLAGRFLVDNIRLRDQDGQYPDLDLLQSLGSSPLTSSQEQTLLELVRDGSLQYFVDFASPNQIAGLDNGGIVQDRSTFADLLTVGGAGFQLTAYVIAAERGLLAPAEALQRVRGIMQLLDDAQAQGPAESGTTGYQGFFYHFLGHDGRRKQNFDFAATPEVNEALNTVEVSVIDTALAVAGVVTAGEYFGDSDPALREMADRIYGRVNWPFMRYLNPTDPADPANNQFFLGWKPDEVRDDDSGRYGRFQFDNAQGPGKFSSRIEQGQDRPATLDYYTDEALIVALLAMGSPNPAHRLGQEVWDAITRSKGQGGGDFYKTYPGALFSYEFLSVWLPTEFLGPDDHPQPMDLFQNTQQAITATRQYAIDHDTRATWSNGGGQTLWGLSAAEGPFDAYASDGALTAKLGTDGGRGETLILEAEGPAATGAGTPRPRAAAFGGQTMLLQAGESLQFAFHAYANQKYSVGLRYSNDNFGPTESVAVSIDGIPLATISSMDTGDHGAGWNQFRVTGEIGYPELVAGDHVVTVMVAGGDGFGIEFDALIIGDVRPVETGTSTVYGAGSAIVHEPELAIAALWEAFQRDFFHPRAGMADAFNLDIAAARPSLRDSQADPNIFRDAGAWTQTTGFAIDHGPLAILTDNFLSDQFVPRQFTAHAGIQSALRQLFHPWTHADNPLDVNKDSFVAPNDALFVINELNLVGSHSLPVPTFRPDLPMFYLDVSPDGIVAPIDALLVINFLNGLAAAEGEPRNPALVPASGDGPALTTPTRLEQTMSLHGGLSTDEVLKAWSNATPRRRLAAHAMSGDRPPSATLDREIRRSTSLVVTREREATEHLGDSELAKQRDQGRSIDAVFADDRWLAE